jgi:hypothetical protein
MGLFDLFGKKKGEAPKASSRDLDRWGRLLANKFSQNLDRQDAIAELSRLGTAESAKALLRRFDWQLDPSITDQEEKENCLQAIVAVGEPALEPVRNYAQKAESLMWPMKVMKGVLSGEELTNELLTLLDQFDTEYTRNVEPKVQLIAELAEHKTDDVRVALEPFLQDASEPVRFAAVTSLFAIANAASVPALVEALAHEESLRVKNRIAQGLAQQAWDVPEGLRPACQKALPGGYRLEGAVVRGATSA